ncbi:hypothetical protein [Paraclostridium sordellii]|uniref:hypothetical protein n=1 Tax=Paraclostridium sordellii TaxID=1505 RepID=UPI0005E8E494|nr:hypothetical protein [Paeniclostridium sordellii]CEN81239.1 Uncharacterised protein [[Clostridium] sordellii] [Paeniclostridium sordellii]
MIKIGEYESLNFIRWIKTKDINHENDILRLADDYINKNKKNWGIKFFLKLYQDYLVNIMQSRYVNNYMETFEEFCSDINNLKYIQIFTVDKAPYLQSIFQNLYIYKR